MRVVALLTVRNEERYLAQCLEHLHDQGIETCLIDNGSTDRTLEIARRFLGRGLLRIEHFPFNGSFELTRVLLNEERLAKEIDADWFMHHDADEIRQAPKPYKTLREGIEDADRQGYNAINFDEFVFLPTSGDESFEGGNYVESMKYYYFFEPNLFHRLNAWKKTDKINLHQNGGHKIDFEHLRVFPVNFILRHYIFLSKSHGISKYAGRVYSVSSIQQRGWNHPRISFSPENFNLPKKTVLKKIDKNNNWDKTDPWLKHFFLESASEKTQVQLVSRQSQTEKNRVDLDKLLPMPIIIGAPRSGTTLLRLMLDAHPNLSIPPETHFIPSFIQIEDKFNRCPEVFYQNLISYERWPDFHLSSEKLYENLNKIEFFTLSEGLRCFYKMYAERFQKSRCGDKTPPYVLHIKDIQATLPEAHFIHIIRDGRDVALSLKNLWWGPGNNMQAQASRWLWRIREARQQAQFCPHYLEVRYEELIVNTTKVLKEICSFINLPYNSEMEDYYKSAQIRLDELNNLYKPSGNFIITKEQYLSIHSRTSQPPDKSRIGRWRREMSDEDRTEFEAVAGSMLRDLGYETGKVRPQLKLPNIELFESGPNMIGCTGGSGSRVVARIIRRGGIYMGTHLKESEDALALKGYGKFLDRFIQYGQNPLPEKLELEMIEAMEIGLKQHLEGFNLGEASQLWGWKCPRNLYMLSFLHRHFPQMKFLHLVRDGRDMAYSHNQNQLKAYASILLSPSEQQWSQPLQSIALWNRVNLFAAEYGEKNMPGQYLRIRFEDLCFEPVGTIDRIFEFFGLSGDVQKIAREEVSPPTTMGRWRTQDAQTVARLNQIGSVALQKFGYLVPEEGGSLNLETGVISNLALEKSCRSRLQEIQADLERSQSRLSEIKSQL